MVDVVLAVASWPCDDDLASTIDYSKVAELVVSVIQSGPFQLIETLAEVIAQAILEQQLLASSVQVTVHKPSAPLPQAFTDVAVTITRSRQT